MPFNIDPSDPTKLPPYWEALGRFIYYYSRVENAMKITLRLVTRTRPATARALFSGVRIRGAIDFIRRTREEEGRKIPKYVEEAFGHIAGITTERDRILHYGIHFYETGDFVTDENAQITSKVRVTQITVDDLRDMAGDTIVVWARLLIYNQSLVRRKQPWPNRPAWVEASRRPWRYRPPQPARDQGKPRGTKPKRSRQPQS
jgi:hypothetical protein